MNSRKRNYLARVALALTAAVAIPAAAQQPAPHVNKIGYVDAERVLRHSRAALEAQKGLDAEFQKRDLEIAAGPQADLERRRSALGEEMNQRRDDALRRLILKTNDIIRRIAEAEKFDVVFLEAVYHNARIDLTDKVITEVDAGR